MVAQAERLPRLSDFLEERPPRWSTVLKQVLLIQPSSAAAERVFSILKTSFNEQQDWALIDYIQAIVMAQYNKR